MGQLAQDDTPVFDCDHIYLQMAQCPVASYCDTQGQSLDVDSQVTSQSAPAANLYGASVLKSPFFSPLDAALGRALWAAMASPDTVCPAMLTAAMPATTACPDYNFIEGPDGSPSVETPLSQFDCVFTPPSGEAPSPCTTEHDDQDSLLDLAWDVIEETSILLPSAEYRNPDAMMRIDEPNISPIDSPFGCSIYAPMEPLLDYPANACLGPLFDYSVEEPPFDPLDDLSSALVDTFIDFPTDTLEDAHIDALIDALDNAPTDDFADPLTDPLTDNFIDTMTGAPADPPDAAVDATNPRVEPHAKVSAEPLVASTEQVSCDSARTQNNSPLAIGAEDLSMVSKVAASEWMRNAEISRPQMQEAGSRLDPIVVGHEERPPKRAWEETGDSVNESSRRKRPRPCGSTQVLDCQVLVPITIHTLRISKTTGDMVLRWNNKVWEEHQSGDKYTSENLEDLEVVALRGIFNDEEVDLVACDAVWRGRHHSTWSTLEVKAITDLEMGCDFVLAKKTFEGS